MNAMEGFLFITVLILTVFIINAAILLYFRKLNQKFQDHIEQEHAKLRRELKVVRASSIGVGERVAHLEDYLENLSYRQDKAELRQSSISSYSHAAKMAEMGGSEEDIMSSCGLTRAEAELVSIIKKKQEKEVNDH